MKHYSLQSGYALLTAIILTATLVLVAYAVANIALRQLTLTTTNVESHNAFYVADSGLECAMFWDIKNPSNPTRSAFDPSAPIASVTCGGVMNTVTFSGSGGGTSVNVALGKTATQQSTYDGITGAGNAIDNNTNGNYPSGSITHTNTGLSPHGWWEVDLGSSLPVNSVVIWNRTDCCSARLTDYWVFISDTPFLSGDTAVNLQTRPGTFGYHQTSAPNPSTSISTSGASGRYVRVQLSGSAVNNTGGGYYLSLAEVQVFSTTGASGESRFQIPVGASCADVTVAKSAGNMTTIESRGYNTCGSGPRFERAIRISY